MLMYANLCECMLMYVNYVISRLAHDIYTIRHERELSTVQEIHAMLQAHVQLLDQVSPIDGNVGTIILHEK